MIKLNDLDEKTINWYFKEVKGKVDKKIEECKKTFEGDGQIQENNKILEALKKLKEKKSKYLIGNIKDIIDIDDEEDDNNVDNDKKDNIETEKRKEEVMIEGVKLEENIEFSINLEEPNISEDSVSSEQLDLLKKIFENKTKEEKQEKYKLKWKHFLMYIFDYKGILDSKKKKVTLRNRLLSKMNIKTCPYCDRQYITNYNSNKSTADLDHFYSQSKYPYLALNIYNFIPACAVCNRNFKNKDEIGINPRVEEFGENAVFTLGNDIDTYLDMELKDIDIKLDVKAEGELESKIRSNINIFKLEEVYKIHNDYVFQMIKDITFRGNKSYLESIEEFFSEKSEEKNKKETEIIGKLRDLVKEPYRFRIREKEPLGKLTKDILSKLEKKMK